MEAWGHSSPWKTVRECLLGTSCFLRDCSGKPAAVEVKPGVNGYLGAAGEQTDAKVIHDADFGFEGIGKFS